MYDTIIFSIKNEETVMIYLSYMFLILGAVTFISMFTITAPYGRYSRTGFGIFVPAKVAWVLQELPAFLVPILLALLTDCPKSNNYLNIFAVACYIIHYVHRGGKPTPLTTFLMAFSFCVLMGYLQGGYLLKYARLEWTPQTCPRIIAGIILFITGMVINIYSDHILRNLRKPGETGYKIPYGGLFTYVSGANFLGEIIEWSGFAVLTWTLPALSFAVFTLCNIGPRAVHHHRWYKEKFEDYPRERKALIPYIL